jgi:hypothetical protein
MKDVFRPLGAGADGRYRAGFVRSLAAAGLRAGATPDAVARLVASEIRFLERFAGLDPGVSLELRLQGLPARSGRPFLWCVLLAGVARGATARAAREAAASLAADLDLLLDDDLDGWDFVPARASVPAPRLREVVELARAEGFSGTAYSVAPFRAAPRALGGAFGLIAAAPAALTLSTVIAPARLLPPEETAFGEMPGRRRVLLARTFLGSTGTLPSALLQAVAHAVGGAEGAAIRRPRDEARAALEAEWREHSFPRPADSVAPPALSRLVFLSPPAAAAPLLPLPLPGAGGRVDGLPLPALRGTSLSIEDPGSGVFFGNAVLRRGTQPVRLRAEDFARHTYVVGKTGTGKSTLLRRLILDDIEAGNGVGLIDPHGDLAESVLAAIPPHRIEDVVYFDPSDLERPVGLNLFDAETIEEQRLLVSEGVAIFERLYGPEIFSPRLQDYFRNFALTLVESGLGAALPDIVSLLLPSDFQATRRRAAKDPFVQQFWQQYDEQADRERREMVPYFAAKFSPFYAEPLMRNVMGQTTRNLRLGPLMDGRAILLANLAKGAIGEANSRLLGMVLVAKIQSAAMMRVRQDPGARVPFRLYVDEFQSFVTPAFSCLLSEGRKYGLTLVLANQFLEQLKRRGYGAADTIDLLDAIEGNVGNLVAFRVGPKDAQVLAPMLGGGEDAGALTALPNFHAVASLLDRGEPRPPLLLRTERIPTPPPDHGRALASVSRLRHGRARSVVEAELARRLDLQKGAA